MNRTIGAVQLGGWDPSSQLRDDLNLSGLGSAWKPTFAMFDMDPAELNRSLRNMKYDHPRLPPPHALPVSYDVLTARRPPAGNAMSTSSIYGITFLEMTMTAKTSERKRATASII